MLLHSRSIVFKRFRPRGPEDAKAPGYGFSERDDNALGGFLNAYRSKARYASNLVVYNSADGDVFAVYRCKIV